MSNRLPSLTSWNKLQVESRQPIANDSEGDGCHTRSGCRYRSLSLIGGPSQVSIDFSHSTVLVPSDDLTDDPAWHIGLGPEIASDRLGVIVGDDQDEADPHVEDSETSRRRAPDRSPVARGKTLGNLPGPLETQGATLRENARRVVDQAAARDVGDPVDDPLDPVMAINRLEGPDVNAGRPEKTRRRRCNQARARRSRV